jgi:hypothetical protein
MLNTCSLNFAKKNEENGLILVEGKTKLVPMKVV